ncbi:long-chain fatty acid--CoA ligase [Rhodoblastus sphagnicola]|uniref:Long-chain-fatty-acid--CoA ligase n=1 Tax=Rhodoblastus sphagnicola TaxID=333368 RepID=A0A2S6N5J9_9HYPH|nr:AMP-binding protein [Rhodoblastus sphagnicola]MBB4197294.1 long-chain acyl-CoA synthetase [Rhodoblastus sphagnicola]PPQ29895.1 long-chain fatty acid--CoA ligase [Rhodoblastus sphagnicola]
MNTSAELLVARPWLRHYPPGRPLEMSQPPYPTLVELWRGARAKFANRVVAESFGARLTYEQMGRAADSVTAWLQAQGFKKGERAAIMGPNVMAYPAVMIGILQAGGVVVNVNPLYTSRELEFQLVDSTPRFLFVLENFGATVAAVRDKLPVEQVILLAPGDLIGLKGHLVNFVSRRVKKAVPEAPMQGATTFTKILAEARKLERQPVAVSGDDLAVLQYTGGTTGTAKGAMLLHRNLIANVQQGADWFGDELPTTATVMITALPLYHIFALTACFWFQILKGGSCLLIANPRDIQGFVKTLQKSRFHIFAGVNTLYNALADHPDIGKVDFSTMALSIAGGMAMQAAVARKWRDLTGKPVLEGYGLSETSPVLCCNRPDIEAFTGTVGYPVPSTEISIRNAEGVEVAQGETGEICARGPQVMPGYWDRPMATQAVMTADGFFRTGDGGVFLADGQLKIVDRLKDLIIVSGFNVYPNEVEDVLVEHPLVNEAAVVGRPSAASGEEVVAFVVPRGEGLTEEDLRKFCRERLTGYKTPRAFLFREDLPKSNVGKVLRRKLKEQL